MTTKELLTELAELLEAQVAHVVTGDHQALLAGAARHEAIVEELAQAQPPEPDTDMRGLVERIELNRAKLQELLTHESSRADFLLRLYLGAVRPGVGAAGYPASVQKSGQKSGPGLFNTRA